MISNKNLKKIDLQHWRSKIGIVFQESYLINDTISANIALGEKYINQAKVKESLIKANAYEFVRKLEKGINQNILDRGSRFSEEMWPFIRPQAYPGGRDGNQD